MVYLFIGEDCLSKDTQLKAIRQQFLPKKTEQFNLDILYAKELTLNNLQERLSCLPVNSPKRIVVVKDAQELKEDIKQYFLRYIKAPFKQIIIVLDINKQEKLNEFTNQIVRCAKVFRFKETRRLDTFTLNRQIAMKKPDYALRVLNQLLKEGERPERILGGLRYAWERDATTPLELKRRLKLLLNCDIDIKTGRLKPLFALERLVISLCSLVPPRN